MMIDSVRRGTRTFLAIGAALALALASCSGGGGGDSGPIDPPSEPTCADGRPSFTSTFEGIQKQIFEKHGCTEAVCHGSSHQGGLDLSPAVAYSNIFQKKALGSSLNLIEPGDNDRSYLWLKLAAGTAPGSVEINGAPMPNGRAPLSEEEIELLHLWIYAGAPETGTVIGSEKVLDACLPDPEPLTIVPLDPPSPEAGIQYVLPPWELEAGSEREICFATYYDFTEQTPAAFKDPSGTRFRFEAFELRQDPQSHHLLLYYSPLNFTPGGIDVHDPSFGRWTCRGGPSAGAECEPRDLTSCGEGGVCASQIETSFACSGYGPSSREPAEIVGGAGQSQAYMPFFPGVYAELPLKGVLYWNSHAFNLTDKGTMMNGRLNYLFATEQTHQVERISVFDAIFTPDAAPFTKETYCNDAYFPRGARIFHLFSHTHRHGQHFWATLRDGTQIYENFSYTDPVQKRYDPPLAFDSPDFQDRVIRYCATYNNGVNADGSPDTELVTRHSRLLRVSGGQFGGNCRPVGCVAGQVGAKCRGEDDDAACDSSPGAGDGWCDACRITGGESTENEMFVLFGAMYLDPTVAAGGQ